MKVSNVLLLPILWPLIRKIQLCVVIIASMTNTLLLRVLHYTFSYIIREADVVFGFMPTYAINTCEK